MPTPHSHRPAFTLIELVVVLAIIAVLGALMLTVISRAQQYAFRTSCASNLRQMGMGVNAFADDHHGLMVDGNDASGQPWYVALAPYVSNAQATSHSQVRSELRAVRNVMVGCPLWVRRNPVDDGDWRGLGYGFNPYLDRPNSNANSIMVGSQQSGGERRRFFVASISFPSQRILIGDGNDKFLWERRGVWGKYAGKADPSRHFGTVVSSQPFAIQNRSRTSGANYLMVDGGVRFLTESGRHQSRLGVADPRQLEF